MQAITKSNNKRNQQEYMRQVSQGQRSASLPSKPIHAVAISLRVKLCIVCFVVKGMRWLLP